ncbi:transglutaminase-like domain-containing protein [Deferribacteres bacterium DY0037]
MYKKIIFLILLVMAICLPASAKENVLFGPTDTENPLHVWNIEITDYWLNLSNKILSNYANAGLTPHQKAMLFLKYTENYKIVFPEQGAHPKYVVEEQVGSCGTFTNVFLALMKVNGYNGRIANLHNFPANYGHTVAEVFYNGKWHLYDTTYSAYFTTEPGNIVDPYILSFDEINKGNSKAYIQIYNLERYYKGILASKFISFDIYKLSEPAGPIGLKHKMYFPLSLDLKTKPKISKSDFNTKNQGASYIGAAGINQNHKYTITSLVKNNKYKLVLTPNFIGKNLRV